MIKIGKTIILNENETVYRTLTREEMETSDYIIRIDSTTGKISIIKSKYSILTDKK